MLKHRSLLLLSFKIVSFLKYFAYFSCQYWLTNFKPELSIWYKNYDDKKTFKNTSNWLYMKWNSLQVWVAGVSDWSSSSVRGERLPSGGRLKCHNTKKRSNAFWLSSALQKWEKKNQKGKGKKQKQITNPLPSRPVCVGTRSSASRGLGSLPRYMHTPASLHSSVQTQKVFFFLHIFDRIPT